MEQVFIMDNLAKRFDTLERRVARFRSVEVIVQVQKE